MLKCRYDETNETAGGQKEPLTEGQWQQLKNTMPFVVEQQAKTHRGNPKSPRTG